MEFLNPLDKAVLGRTFHEEPMLFSATDSFTDEITFSNIPVTALLSQPTYSLYIFIKVCYSGVKF